jgi:hypothetical protein
MSSAPKSVMPKVLPSPCGNITIGQGGHGDLVSITFTMTLTPKQCDDQLVGRWRGLKHGLVGGTTVELPVVKGILADDEDMPSGLMAGACGNLIAVLTNEVLKPLVEVQNPQVAMLAELEEARAKAKAYDQLVAKLAEDEAKKKEAQAKKTAKMVATKALLKAKSGGSVASSHTLQAEPVADEVVAEPVAEPVAVAKPVAKKVIKTKAPALAPEEIK